MEKLIAAISQDKVWNKWVIVNSAEGAGCISAGKEGCISIMQACSQPKSGCIS